MDKLNYVPGYGNTKSKIVIVGEAPGAEEEKTRKPFVGRSGKLIDTCLKSLHTDRESLYITNVLKFRPENNRDPFAWEVKKAVPMLRQEINNINPTIVLTLGRFAAKVFLGENFKITRDRGQMYNLVSENYKVLPTFHPAYILRNMSKKDIFQQDLASALREAYGQGRR